MRTMGRSLAQALCAVVLAFPVVPPSSAAEWPVPAGRPRVGLVLSGGGARGAAHVGVLRVLEEHRIPVDLIAGTSMGALVGGLYASGLSPAQLDSVITTNRWAETFADNIPRGARSFHRKRDDDLPLVKHKPGFRGGQLLFPPGFLDGYRVDLMLKRLSLPVATVRDFDRLRIPYRAVAADIVTGERVVLGQGDLALAMRSSMSIPAAFAPRVIDGHRLVDGGIVDNLPIELARQMGADVVIAVDIGTPPPTADELTSIPAITAQLATLASDRNRDRQVASLTGRDVLIQPALGSITTASFDRAAEAIPIGARAAEAALGKLGPLALSPDDYRAYRAARDAREPAGGPPGIAAVRIENRSRIADAVLAERLAVPAAAPLDVPRLERQLDQVYGLELFESVYWDLAPGPAGDTLVVSARERAWGPDYLQAGLSVAEDFEHPNFNVMLAYSRTAIDRLNGEWTLGAQIGQEPGAWSELHQPLDSGLRTFVDVEPRYGERNLSLFDARGDKIAELVLPRYGATFAAGRELGTWGELRAGLLREGGRIRTVVGEPGVPVGRYDTGEAFAQFWADRLDEVTFPRRGASLRARVSTGERALGSRTSYQQLDVEGLAVATRGRVTASVSGLFGTTRHSDAPLERRFCLGGLGQLSGLQQDERVGQHALLLRTMLYRRLGGSPVLPLYAGLSGEFGNVFASRAAIGLAEGVAAGAVFLGFDSPLGSGCMAYGRAEGGRGNWYFTIGQPLGGHRPGFRLH